MAIREAENAINGQLDYVLILGEKGSNVSFPVLCEKVMEGFQKVNTLWENDWESFLSGAIK